MKLQPRHIFLLLGMMLVFISFFFFISAHATYVKLLAAGLATATVSLLLIYLRDTIRMKALWTAIVILFVFIQQMTEKSLIRQSSKWMIQKNEKLLREVSLMLISKPGEIMLLKTDTLDRKELFAAREWKAISNLFQKTGVKLIFKDSTKIYYETYGFLDSRGGFSCNYRESSTKFDTGMKTFILKWNY